MAPSISVLKSRAGEFSSRGDYEAAINEYEQILDLDPNDAGVLNLMGDAYLRLGLREKAISDFERALEVYLSDEFYSNAIALCKKILRVDPDRDDIYHQLAQLYAKQGLVGEAIEHLLEYADRQHKLGKIDDVLHAYHETIELTPQNPDLRLRLADMHLSQGQTDQAIRELRVTEQLLRDQGRGEESALVLNRLQELGAGAVEAGPQSLDEAALAEEEQRVGTEELEPGRTIDVEPAEPYSEEHAAEPVESQTASVTTPISPEPPKGTRPISSGENYMELGDLCATIGSTDQALDYYTRAGDFYIKTAKPDQAWLAYHKASVVNPLELKPHLSLLKAATMLDDRPKIIEAHTALAYCYTKRNEITEAQRSLEEVLKIDPDNERLRSLVSSLEKSRREKLTEEIGVTSGKSDVEIEADHREITEIEAAAREALEAAERAVSLAEEAAFYTPSGATGSTDSRMNQRASQRSPRLKVLDEPPTPDTDAFSLENLIDEFKQGVLQSIDNGDYSSHYDLGLAYKEMGLIDEAIAEFQIATKGDREQLKALEMLGQCFYEKGDIDQAIRQFERGLAIEGHDEREYLGLRYHLGHILEEEMGDAEKAASEYQEIYGIDVAFMDVAERLERLGILPKSNRKRGSKRTKSGGKKKKPQDRISYV